MEMFCNIQSQSCFTGCCWTRNNNYCFRRHYQSKVSSSGPNSSSTSRSPVSSPTSLNPSALLLRSYFSSTSASLSPIKPRVPYCEGPILSDLTIAGYSSLLFSSLDTWMSSTRKYQFFTKSYRYTNFWLGSLISEPMEVSAISMGATLYSLSYFSSEISLPRCQ